MTLLMRELHHHLPPEEQYPLPPRVITMNVANRAGVASKLDERERFTLTVGAHYAYGAAAGALYAAWSRPGSRHPVLRGMMFGLGVWAVSYFSLLPAAGLFPPADRQPLRRNALMIAAHLLWGAVLGFVEDGGRRLASQRARVPKWPGRPGPAEKSKTAGDRW